MAYATIVKAGGAPRSRRTWPTTSPSARLISGLGPGTSSRAFPAGGLNIAHETVDRHAAGPRAGHLALRWLGKGGGVLDLTYEDLRLLTNRFANILAGFGVGKGDLVCVLAGRIPALYVAALGTLKNRSVFCPLFSAFGPEPIRTRMEIGNAKVLVTTEALYRPKVAGIRSTLPDLERIIVVGGAPAAADLPDAEDYGLCMLDASDEFAIGPTDPEDLALVLHERDDRHPEGCGPRARGRGRPPRDREAGARPPS